MTHDSWPTRAPQPYLPCGAAVRLEVWPYLVAALTRLARHQTARFERWRRHRRTLRALSRLDGHMLRDIGLPGGAGSIHAAAKALSERPAANENHPAQAA